MGVATSGSDPLARHAWWAEAHYGLESERPSVRATYRYDRLYPTLGIGAEDLSFPYPGGRRRTREMAAFASFPLARSLRSSQAFSLAWRRKAEETERPVRPDRLDFGGLELAWTFASARQYPFSISPTDGVRLRVAMFQENPAFGSELSLTKLLAEARGYLRLPLASVLALRGAGGTTLASPAFRRSFSVGGFPDGTLFDILGSRRGLARGYPEYAFEGRRFASATAEWRVPLAHPQRGWRLVPAFVRHLHGHAFVDAGGAWSDTLRGEDLGVSLGASLGADLLLGHTTPLTLEAGVARGFGERGETRFYLRTGLAF
jgi:hypothetical protein